MNLLEQLIHGQQLLPHTFRLGGVFLFENEDVVRFFEKTQTENKMTFNLNIPILLAGKGYILYFMFCWFGFAALEGPGWNVASCPVGIFLLASLGFEGI